MVKDWYKTLKNIKLYIGHYFIGDKGSKRSRKDVKREVVSTIEMVFQHGDCVFISTAELTMENKIEQSLFNFMLYNDRRTGIIHDLISEPI